MRGYTRLLGVSIAIWALGAAAFLWGGYYAVSRLVTPIHDFSVPGSIVQRLDEGRNEAILLHVRGSVLGSIRSHDVSPSELACTAHGPGVTVRAKRIGGYGIAHGGDTYESKLGFRAPRTGSYRIACVRLGGRGGSLPMAVSRRLYLWKVFVFGFAGMAACAAAIMVGVVVARRARRDPLRPATRP